MALWLLGPWPLTLVPWPARSSPPAPPEPKSWHATLEQIEAADWALSANRYKPQIAASPDNEDPETLINDVIRTEEVLLQNLRSLLVSLK